jgi:hypothetical protein
MSRAAAHARCSIAECDEPAAPEAPLPLCVGHLALAADWVGQEFGVEDVLPSPCAACGSRLGVRYPAGWVCAVCEWEQGTSPDGELPRPRVDVVYYIRFGERMKIGTTSNLRQRMSRLWHEELVALERGGRARERARHAQFASRRLGTSEWFELGPELSAHVETLRAGVADPWDLYARWVSEAVAARA